ncbi:macrophage migration inhibitory factor homolog [Achroia grisella]|uniref:macrophage migration inhibitory factor homolog n=1 Tax=Achroia grisella TaxID=688607 RepID=UPI0027D316E5|nr:macrophage migration inhibitory factor homolog [Achroia grisella]
MPCLKILTNLPKSKIPADFVDKILPLLSRVVKKPVDKFLCIISGDCQVSFGGESTSPGAVATLESIGHLGPIENKVIIKEVSEFIEKELGISPNRFFLSFYDIKGYNIGKGGVTIE